MLPEIKTELPGPKSRALLEKDERYISPSYTRSYPAVVVRGTDCLVEDPDGNVFLDMNAGIAVCSTGHCHPEVVEAAVAQTRNLIHMSGTDFYYPSQIELAETLATMVPGGGEWRVFFANSGAEAVEASIKLAKWKTGRPNLVAFTGAFHGRTHGALSLTCSKSTQKQRFHPLLPGVYHAPYPDTFRGPFAGDPRRQAEYCGKEWFEQYLFAQNIEPDSVAAIVVETVQGEGGYLVPPQGFLENLRELTRKHGIMLVFDEVQCGVGRTGKFFAFEHFGVVPDIVSMAKGIASGFPLGICLARKDVMVWPPGTHASTFGGNPVACAAALKTIELIRTRYLANCQSQGEHMKARLLKWKERFPFVGDVRGLGLMLGVDIVEPGTKKWNGKLRDTIVDLAFARGILILGAGKSTLRFSPPLTIQRKQVDYALDEIEKAMAGLA